MFRRTRYQQGSLQRAKRGGGRDTWLFRWYEDQPNGGKRYRKTVVGTVVQFPLRPQRGKLLTLRASTSTYKPRMLAAVRRRSISS
jgi:hypothetical protein